MQESYATVKMLKGKKIFQLQPWITPGSPKWLYPNRVQKLLVTDFLQRSKCFDENVQPEHPNVSKFIQKLESLQS